MGADDWYLANIQQFGFFRVNYDDENWARLSQQLVLDHEVSRDALIVFVIPVANEALL